MPTPQFEPLDEFASRGLLVARPVGGWDIALGAAGVAGACAAAVIISTGGVVSAPTAFATVLAASILTFTAGALIWRHGRPTSAVGNMLLVEGFLVAAASLTGSPVRVVYLVGVLAGWAAALGATWLLLAFPGARLHGAARVVMGTVLAALLLGVLPLILVSSRVPPLSAIGSCAGACPANPALLVDAPRAAHAFRHVEAALQAIWALGLVTYLAMHFARASHPRRRLLAPLFAASAPFVAAFAADAVVANLAGVRWNDHARAAFAGAWVLFPLGFIAALLFARAYAGAALEFLARRLVGRPSIAVVEQLVRRVLDDPQAKLAFWLPRRRQFADRHGARVVLDPAGENVVWRTFGHDATPVIAVVHDAALSDDPELVEAVGAASLLTLENRQLQQDLLDSVDALRASQRRLVRAASAERRKIERDLHDGVQQQLVALRIRLALALDLADGEETVLAGRLAGLGEEFDDALDELRWVAHGIYPPLLADEGLAAALQEAARRSTVPIAAELEDVGRLSDDREAAVYYCCLEALQNVAKHAGEDASASVRLWRDGRVVRFTVSDDGTGFSRHSTPSGAGLTNMTDRIGAVGGSISVTSAPGEGTTVEGRVRVEPDDRAKGNGAHD